MGQSGVPEHFNAEVYKILKDSGQVLYFEWNLQTDVLTFTETDGLDAYGFAESIECASSAFWLEVMHPEDRDQLAIYLDLIFRRNAGGSGARKKSINKVRLLARNGEYLWTDFRIVTYFSEGAPSVAFGSIQNINDQEMWQQKMQHEIDHDLLTGFLNKTACHRECVKYLEALRPVDTPPALMIVDADGFKEINDSFGHLFGDGVLKDMAMTIEKNFRHTDIIGRMGGDEFLVLFKEVPSGKVLEDRCSALNQAMDRKYENGDAKLPFSVSIGVALCPEHGKTYDELFKHADRALYEAKTRGKNRYYIYKPSLLAQSTAVSSRDPAHTADMQQKAFKDNMLEFIFKLLYETNNPEATITLCISMFGKQFNLDRVSIDRYSKLANQYANAYEWISPHGVSLRPESFGEKNHDDMMELVDKKNELVLNRYHPTPYGVLSLCSDVFSVGDEYREISRKLSLGSFVHCRITHGTEDLGCIGFESRQRTRRFTKEELTDLNIFAVLLGNILLLGEADHMAETENEHLRDILDHMQEFIYIVDKDTHEPVYFNRTIRQALGSTVTNQPCYKRFHQLNKVCDGCPIQRLSLEGNEYLDVVIDNWGAPTPTRVYNVHWEDQKNRHLALVIQESF